MSFSKPFYTFPYYDYPYTYKEKFYFYSNKIFCGCMGLLGTGIYVRFLWKQPYSSDKQIADKSTEQLNDLIKLSKEKRFWHVKGFFANILLFVPSVYGIFKYDYLPQQYYKYFVAGAGLFLINSIYGIMAHTYNSLRFTRQSSIIAHGVRISRAIRAFKRECKDININGNTVEDQKNIQLLLYQEMIKQKTTWFIIDYKINYASDNIDDQENPNMDDQNSENQYINLYVVRNGYYEKLFFVFDTENIANEFMAELNKISSENVDYLFNNPEHTNSLRKAFITKKLSTHMVYNYYIHNQ